MDESDFQNISGNFVRDNVILCVNTLVHALVQGAFREGSILDEDTAIALMRRDPDADDYAEASQYLDGDDTIAVTEEDDGFAWTVTDEDGDETDSGWEQTASAAWREAFDSIGEEHPDGGEVYEHYVVSDYLADLLRKRGETVLEVEEINMTIWARAATGQPVKMDGVIRRIVREEGRIEEMSPIA